MRTAKGGQRAASLEQFERAQVDFLVAAKGVGNGGAIAREGRRVEHDQIKSRRNFFVRLHRGLRLEPIENVHGFKGAFFRQSIICGMTLCLFNGFLALIQEMDMICSRPNGVQAETAQETEAVQDLSAFYQPGDALVVDLLVEV